MAAACARMLGVQTLYMVDDCDDRLGFAADMYGAIPVRFDTGAGAAAKIIGQTGQYGVDAAIDAVGFDGRGSPAETMLTTLKIEAGNAHALRQAVTSVRRGGTLCIAGFYAGSSHAIPLGEIFEKGLSIKAGRTHAKRYLPQLLRFVEEGKLHPEAGIQQRLPHIEATEAIKNVDIRT